MIVQRSAKAFRSYENHPLATAIRNLQVRSENKGFGAATSALIVARNNHHHGRGPCLEEDGPGFPQEAVRFPRALPRGDLLLDLGDQNWVPLYPIIVAPNCSHCRYRDRVSSIGGTIGKARR